MGLDDTSYYRQRAVTERALALSAECSDVREIHEELARLYEALDLPQGSNLTAAFKARTAAEWEAWALERDLPIVAVAEKAAQDEHGS